MAVKLIIRWFLVFDLLFSSYCYGFDQEIQLNLKSNATGVINMEAGQQFRIKISDLRNEKGRCRWISSNSDYEDINFQQVLNTEYHVSGLIRAPPNAGDWWYECIFYTKYSDCNNIEGRTCFVNLDGGVIGEDEGIVCVRPVRIHNRRETEYPSALNLIVNSKKYNQDDKYFFFHGEGTKFICYKTGGRTKLSYTSTGKVISTGYGESTTGTVSMYMKLTAANDGDVLECTHEEQHPTIRLTLTHNRNIKGMSPFLVNGSPLPLKTENSAYYYTRNYEYRYFAGESIKVDKSLAWDGMEEDCFVEGTGLPNQLDKFKRIHFKLEQLERFTLNGINNGTYLQCSVGQQIAVLTFWPQTFSYQPEIIGLPQSHVLLEYQNYENNVYNIQYEIGDGTLYLYCSSDNRGWIYDTEVTTRYDTHGPRSFQLKPGKHSAIVNCKDNYNKVTRLILVRRYHVNIPNVQPVTSKPIFIPETANTNIIQSSTDRAVNLPTTQRTPPAVTTPQTENIPETTIGVELSSSMTPALGHPAIDVSTTQPEVTNTSPQPGDLGTVLRGGFWFIVGVVMLVILLILGVWMCWSYKKKRLLIHNTSNMEYQNLPEHRGGPMTTPPQWDRPENVYDEPIKPACNQNMYSQPIPKSQRNIMEPTYAQPRDSISTTYAAVQHNDSTYAAVQNNDPTYAAVQNDDPTYAAVQNNDPTYAAVQNDKTYATLQKNASNHKTGENNTVNYANQNTIEYQNLDVLTRANSKKKSNIGNNSKDIDMTNTKDNGHKNHSQNTERIEKKNIEYANLMTEHSKNINYKLTEMPSYSKIDHEKTYANFCEELNAVNKNGRYINVDASNDIEPAYCEILKSKKYK